MSSHASSHVSNPEKSEKFIEKLFFLGHTTHKYVKGETKPQIILQNRFLWLSLGVGEWTEIDWWAIHAQFACEKLHNHYADWNCVLNQWQTDGFAENLA